MKNPHLVSLGLPLSVSVAALALALAPAAARAQELDNEWVTIPAPVAAAGFTFSGWDNFEILLGGQPTFPTQNAADTATDPFASISGPTPAAISVTPAANGNTLLEFSGNPFPSVAPGTTAHFGVTGPANDAPLDPLAKYWSGEELGPDFDYPVYSSVPAVNGIVPQVLTPANWEVVYVAYAQDGVAGGSWLEFPISGSSPITPTFTSGSADSSDPITFSNAGFLISSTQIPLDDLNFTDEPAPGTAGTQFTTMPDPGSIPEPSSLALLGVGGISVLVYRWRR